jgi:hypothetical protein
MKKDFTVLSPVNITTYNMPFDFNSVMMYWDTEFSKDGTLKTIEPLVPLPKNVKIGQRNKLSDLDVERIRRHFNCDTTIDPDKTQACSTFALCCKNPDKCESAVNLQFHQLNCQC